MKSHSHYRSILWVLGVASLLHAQTDSTTKLTVGTLVNLDIGGIAPSGLTMDNIPVALSDAELSFTMPLRPNLEFQTLLVHDAGTASIDQAFATWHAPWLDLAFGRQTLPLGLYPGHLAHDPLLQEDLETIAPSVVARKTTGAFTGHLGFANLSQTLSDPPSTDTTSEGEPSERTEVFPALVMALDARWAETGLARLSTRLAHHCRTVSLGAQIPMGNFNLDLEGLATAGAWSGADFAALAGLAWQPVQVIEIATRYDARKAHSTATWKQIVGTGATLRFAEMAYTTLSWVQDIKGKGALTLRLGIEGEFSVP